MCLAPSLSLKPREENVDLTWEESIPENLKKKRPDLFLPICSFVRAFLLRLCWEEKKEGLLQSHKPTG